MKTIEFQKEPHIIDSITVAVNDEKRPMHQKSLKKQVSKNWQLMRWYRFFSIAAMTVAFVIHFVLLNRLTLVIFSGVIILCPMIFFIIMRKKFFVGNCSGNQNV